MTSRITPATYLNALVGELRATLHRGAIYSWRHAPTGITISVFGVAGGSFTRVDVRDERGITFGERSHTYRFQSLAEQGFRDLVTWLEDSTVHVVGELADARIAAERRRRDDKWAAGR